MNTQTAPTMQPEILEGARAIADFMGFESPRSIYSAVEANSLPVFRVGKKICARRSTLHSFIAKQEASAKAPAPAQRKAA